MPRTTYYVSKHASASNSNGGTNATTDAWATIAYGCATMAGGDTLQIGAGTYNENLDDVIKSGSTASWDDATIIEPYNSETVILTPDMTAAPYPSNGHHIRFINKSWIILNDLDIDNDAAYITGTALAITRACTYIRINNCKVHGSKSDGSIWLGGVTSDTDPGPTFCEILNCEIYEDQLPPADNGHGIYITRNTSNCIFRGNHIHDMNGFGLHLYYNGNTPRQDDNLLEQNNVHDCGETGVLIAGGDDNIFQNNLIHNNTQKGVSLGSYSTNRTLLYNNTIYNNGGIGLHIGVLQNATDTVATNNIVYNNSGGEIVEGAKSINTTLTTNYTTDPNFTTPGATPDLHLSAGSGAINTGTDLSASGVTVDYEDIARPQGGAFDIGAYEYGTQPGDSFPIANDDVAATFVDTAVVIDVIANDED